MIDQFVFSDCLNSEELRFTTTFKFSEIDASVLALTKNCMDFKVTERDIIFRSLFLKDES